MITNLCTAALSNFLVCKTMLFNRGYFIQGAFTMIQEPPWKNQGLFKDIQKFFQFQELFKDVMFFQGLFKAQANDMQHTHVIIIALGWKTPTTAGATIVTCLLLLFSSPPFQSSSPSHCTYIYSESPLPQPNITVNKTNPNPKPQALNSYQLAECTKEVLSKHNLSEP